MIIGLIVVAFLCTLPIACLIGAIKGTIDGCKLVAQQRREQIKDKAIAAGEITPVLELPPDIADEIQALEYSADVYRRKKGYFEQQAAVIYDPLEKIKLEEKAAQAQKKMISEMKKVGKIKDKYAVKC